MAESRPWKWTRRFSAALSLAVAVFSAWWFVAPFLHLPWLDPSAVGAALLAVIVGSSQGLANCMAANARRIRGTDSHGWSGAACVVLWAAFAGVSWFGLHNGWAMAKAAAPTYAFPADWIMEALFVGIALAEPTMNWVVDLLKKIQADEEAAEEERFEAKQERRSQRLYGTSNNSVGAERRGNFSVIDGGVVGAAIVAAGAGGAGVVEESFRGFPIERPAPTAPKSTTQEAHESHGWRGPKNHSQWNRFVEARDLGLNPVEIIRDTGIPATTVYRWISKLKAAGS